MANVTKRAASVLCASCNQPGHARSNSTLCLLNPKRRRISPAPAPNLQEPDLPEGHRISSIGPELQESEQSMSSVQSSAQCAACNLIGHARSTSKLCPLNPRRRPISVTPVLDLPEEDPLVENHSEENLPDGLPEDEYPIQRHPAAFVEREQVERHSLGRKRIMRAP